MRASAGTVPCAIGGSELAFEICVVSKPPAQSFYATTHLSGNAVKTCSKAAPAQAHVYST